MSASGFHVRHVDGLPVVTGPDEIDVGNAEQFRAALRQAGAEHQPVIVVDLAGTGFCDSTGLNALVRAQEQANDEGTELRLVIGGAALHRILSVTGVTSLFAIYDSLPEALGPGRRPA